jgi:hypothetical protein
MAFDEAWLKRHKKFTQHAQAIGEICMRLSYVEMILANFLCVLIPVKDRNVAQAIAGSTDLKGRIKMVRAIAAVRKPSDAWYDQVDQLLGKIESQHAPKRNRYAHDTWTLDTETDEIVRLHFRTSMPKQAKNGERREASTLDEVKTTIWEMHVAAKEIGDVAVAIDKLRQEYVAAQPQP